MTSITRRIGSPGRAAVALVITAMLLLAWAQVVTASHASTAYDALASLFAGETDPAAGLSFQAGHGIPVTQSSIAFASTVLAGVCGAAACGVSVVSASRQEHSLLYAAGVLGGSSALGLISAPAGCLALVASGAWAYVAARRRGSVASGC